ncbi:hypothetical protein DL96DRAFT_1598292 [Flagelloscypha sp. PMI_526]|nr:hypothetical protein DL96DRAFT_1598292 [Flagelloscypha sp. PMI_526]
MFISRGSPLKPKSNCKTLFDLCFEMPYSYTTYTTTAPMVTAWAIPTYTDTAKIGVSLMHTTLLYVSSTSVAFNGFVVGETGANGAFLTAPPPETMNYGYFGPFTTYRMPIPTGTVTDTFLMDWRDCYAQGTGSAVASMQICYYVGFDRNVEDFRTTATHTFQALAMTTLYTQTTVRSTTYILPTGLHSGGDDNSGNSSGDLAPGVIALIVVLVVMVAAAIFVFACVIYPREHKRGKARHRLRGLYKKKEGPYFDDKEGLVTAASPMAVTPLTAPSSSGPGSLYAPSSTAPSFPQPQPSTVSSDVSMQQRMHAMELEMQGLREQLRGQGHHPEGPPPPFEV